MCIRDRRWGEIDKGGKGQSIAGGGKEVDDERTDKCCICAAVCALEHTGRICVGYVVWAIRIMGGITVYSRCVEE